MSIQTFEAPLLATETPAHLVDHLLDLADVQSRHLLLEPSAGNGAIAYRAVERGARVYTCELNQARADALEASGKFLVTAHADFLKNTSPVRFDRVVMNPPKDNVRHVCHAYSYLKRGGILVALIHVMHLGEILFNLDVPGQSGIVCGPYPAHEVEFLPEDMFHIDGRLIRCAILKLTAPL